MRYKYQKCQGDGSSDKTFDIDYVNNASIAYSGIISYSCMFRNEERRDVYR